MNRQKVKKTVQVLAYLWPIQCWSEHTGGQDDIVEASWLQLMKLDLSYKYIHAEDVDEIVLQQLNSTRRICRFLF